MTRIAITGGNGFVGEHLSIAQVHILAEGVTVPAPFADLPPMDLRPATPFDEASIRTGLPEPGGFGCHDLRWCRA